MRTAIFLNRSGYLTAAFLSAAILSSSFLSAPVIAFGACCLGVWLGVRHRVSNYAAVAISVLLPMLGTSIIVTFAYVQPVQYSFLIDAMLVALVWAFALGVRRTTLLRQTLSRPCEEGVAAILPGAITIFALGVGGNLFGLNLEWVLQGDAQNNTASAILIVMNNGADPSFTAAPALTQLLMSAAIAGTLGFDITDADFVSIHQVQALVLALLWVATSTVFGLIANREFRRHRFAVRAIASFFGALLPLTWFILGFSIAAGFYNTAAAMLSLGLTWLLWREQETIEIGSRWIVVSGLLLVTLFASMAWVPLALIPGVMSGVVIARTILIDRRPRELLNWPVGLSVILFFCYTAAVVVPSFLGHGDSLASDGWMTELPKALVVSAMLLGVISALLFGGKVTARGSAAAGLLLMAVAISLGLAFLMYLASRTGTLWAYYPRKFAWMTTFAIMCIAAFVAIGSRTVADLRPRWAAAAGAMSAMAVFGIWMLQVPFSQTGPLKEFPLLNVAATGQDTTAAVSAIAETVGTKTIRLDYDENDFIVNQWVFQWGSAHELMWGYAYSLIQSPEDVCGAAKTWGGGITLLTRSADVKQSVLAQCGDLIAEVREADAPYR